MTDASSKSTLDVHPIEFKLTRLYELLLTRGEGDLSSSIRLDSTIEPGGAAIVALKATSSLQTVATSLVIYHVV
jgi:hypothetical protein